MSDWRDHANNMTPAQRAAAFCVSEWHPICFYGASKLADLLGTFGHTCANAELERRRAAEAELHRYRAALGVIVGMAPKDEDDFAPLAALQMGRIALQALAAVEHMKGDS